MQFLNTHVSEVKTGLAPYAWGFLKPVLFWGCAIATSSPETFCTAMALPRGLPVTHDRWQHPRGPNALLDFQLGSNILCLLFVHMLCRSGRRSAAEDLLWCGATHAR